MNKRSLIKEIKGRNEQQNLELKGICIPNLKFVVCSQQESGNEM